MGRIYVRSSHRRARPQLIRTMQLLIGFWVLAALLAACGQPAPDVSEVSPAAPSAGSTPVEAGAPSASPQKTYPLNLKHDGGDTTIMKEPGRIVVLGDEMAERALALGIKPVGYGSSRLQSASVGSPVVRTSYLDPKLLGQPKFVGSNLEPSIETILSLKPDLILYLYYAPKIYESASRIAPTLAFDVGKKGAWQRALRVVGQAVDRQEKADEIIRDFDARRKALRDQLAPIAKSSPQVAVLYLPSPDTTMVFDGRFTLAGIFPDLGFRLTQPSGVQIGRSGFSEVSAEALSELDADNIVTRRIKGTEGQRQYQAEEVLSTLGVPIRQYFIDPEHPYTGPYSEPRFMDNSASLLLGRKASWEQGSEVPRELVREAGSPL